MAKYPLLFFPTPVKASYSPLKNGPNNVIKPNAQQQWDRLSPIFRQLEEALEAKRILVQQSSHGVNPEDVLVIETIGSIENFVRAVKLVEGFEWMGELEIDEIVPDSDFYIETHPEKDLNGRLFFIMSNQQALHQLISLWKQYKSNPSKKLQRGYAKFRDVFLILKDIRYYDVKDRLIDTGIIDIWKEDLEYDQDRVITFEIELWFRDDAQLRKKNSKHIMNLVEQAKGVILSEYEIQDIAYHGLLAQLPSHAIQTIIEDPTTELVKCENIMFFKPSGQMIVRNIPSNEHNEITQINNLPLPSGEPVIALFDGVVLANHQLLTERINIDDPDSWESEYESGERIHGSSMASLIIHGDLNTHQSPLARPIYVRPVMKPRNSFHSPRPEGVPEDVLFVALIDNAVKRMFEGDENVDPVASQIRIINLSIGDPSRHFYQSMSPLARLLDYLSAKYSILFVVSAGNHPQSIKLEVSKEKFNNFTVDELEATIISALYKDIKNRKILSPAETINGLSVGALHLDDSIVEYKGYRVDPFIHLLPSPISAFGSGYRRAIKPDIVYPGGKQWYQQPPKQTDTVTIEPSISFIPPGNKVASPGKILGDLNYTHYSCGTSNATALITRAAGIYFDTLQQLLDENNIDKKEREFEVPLLKAMLVHGCSWDDIGVSLQEIIENSSFGNEIIENAHRVYSDSSSISREIRRRLKTLVTQWIGYGFPDIDKVLACTDQRATLLGFGELNEKEAHLYKLPLPPSLSAQQVKRRITITLAWLSPINPNTQKYRRAHLWFEVPNKDDLTPERKNVDWQTAKRGTLQHEVFEGNYAEPFNEDDVIEIKVNCRSDAGKMDKAVSYGLVVSIEVAEATDIPIYNEVRTRIAPAIQIQQI